ncbi:hypothetical protein BGX38DRAFT_1280541 [Terfezia claveryi]|nr:hypothetical protein BGX38DRAFT_1280541 [Terfezia claveryi]
MSPVCLPKTVVSLGDTQRQWCLPDVTSEGGRPQVAECLRSASWRQWCLSETLRDGGVSRRHSETLRDSGVSRTGHLERSCPSSRISPVCLPETVVSLRDSGVSRTRHLEEVVPKDGGVSRGHSETLRDSGVSRTGHIERSCPSSRMSSVCLPETVVSLGDTQRRWCLSRTLRDTERQWCLPDGTSRGGHPQVAECLRCLPETVWRLTHGRQTIFFPDEIMAFMMSGTHLEESAYTTEDFFNPSKELPGAFLRTPKDQSKGKGRAPETPERRTGLAKEPDDKDQPPEDIELLEDDDDLDTGLDQQQQKSQGGGRDPDDSGDDSSDSDKASSVASQTLKRKPKREKSVEHQQWESTTGMVTTGNHKAMNALKGIKIDMPEKLRGEDKKWQDSQYFDSWATAMQRWFVLKRIDLEGASALEIVGFRMEGSALTTYNQFLREKGKNATFFGFILALRDFLIPSTSKDILWK